jgi:lactate permease
MPIAIVAPMLMTLGVPPAMAVAVAAIGHTWAVSLSGMALPFRILSEVTQIPVTSLFPTAMVLLGITVFLSGLAVMFLLNERKHWKRVLAVGAVVVLVEYLTGNAGMIPICGFLGTVAGILTGILLCPRPEKWKPTRAVSPPLRAGLFSYGTVILLVFVVSLIKPLNEYLSRFTWTLQFPEAVSNSGVVTAAGSGYVLHYLVHPGTILVFSSLLSITLFRFFSVLKPLDLRSAFKVTVRGATPATLGTFLMIGLSTIMEHTGMTLAVAKGMSDLLGGVYPLLTPMVGMVGSFATGSNTNSNVLFGLLQKEIAGLIGISPLVLLAAQNTGGGLGSMISPAKLAVGTSTSELKGREGEVLRITLPVGIIITLIIGLVALLMG